MSRRKPRSARSKQFAIITAIAVIGALYWGRAVLIPLAISMLLSFLLVPLVKRAERIGIGRVNSVVLVTAISFCAILATGWLVVTEARAIAVNFPTYRENIIAKGRAVQGSIQRVVGSATNAVEEIRHEIGRSQVEGGTHPDAEGDHSTTMDRFNRPAAESPTGTSAPADQPQPGEDAVRVEVVGPSAALTALTAALTSLVHPLATAGIAFVFVIFILIGREDLRDRVIRLLGGGRVGFSTQALNEVGAAVSRYLMVLFIVNAANGAVIAMCLWLIGLPSPILWGLLMAILRFVPLIGTLTAASLPILLSLATFDNWTYPLAVIAIFIVVDALSANFVEPMLYGPQVGASPMAVLVAATFWTWLWGPIGLLLAMPLTVSLVVLGRYFRPLSFLTILLGNQPALPRELRFYQRLLSNDAIEARAIIDSGLDEGHTHEDVYEQVVAPAVALAKEDHAAGLVDDLQAELVHDTVTAILHEGRAADASSKPLSANPQIERLRIHCVPASSRFDELLCQMLCRLLSEDGMPCHIVSPRVLAGELVEAVETHRVDVLCILAIGRDGDAKARYLVKRLRQKHASLPIVVGWWPSPNESAPTVLHWAAREHIEVAATFGQVREAAKRLAAKAAVELDELESVSVSAGR